MATEYAILREHSAASDTGSSSKTVYEVDGHVEATNAEQACRRVADKMSDDDLKDGVTLIAVPARNWSSGRNTFAAKTERKLIRS